MSRLLYAIRTRIPDPKGALGSWKLSVALTISGALYFGFLAIWSMSSPPHVVQSIAGLIPFWALYGLLLVNTALCLWLRWPLTVLQLSRGHWSALGTYLFHGAFFLLAAAVGLTMIFRHEMTLRVAEGEDYVGASEQIVGRSQQISSPHFRVTRLEPVFWRDQLLFTRLEADLQFSPDRVKTTRINLPIWVGPATFLRLSGFGYAPRYEVRDNRGNLIESLFVKLTVFPPGINDRFTFERFPHTVVVGVIPDAVEKDGRWLSRTLNLANPIVTATISRGKINLAKEYLALGDQVEFEGLSLSFPEIRYWGEFSVVHDPGVPVLFSAFALAIIGLILKFLRVRPEGIR